MAATELVTGITALEGASPLAEGPAKILFSGISGHLGSETAVSPGAGEEAIFQRSLPFISGFSGQAAVCCRLGEEHEEAWLNQMGHRSSRDPKFLLCLSLWPSGASSGFGERSLKLDGSLCNLGLHDLFS